jgi:hypothetical protein
MEDAFHCDSDGLVMGVDWFWVVRPAGWVARLSGGLQPHRPVPHSNTNRDGTRRKFATDSPLEGTGFELPVRGRGQSGCRPFYAAESSGRVGAPSQFSDSTTPCIKAAWTRPPRPQSVPATHRAEVPSSRRADVEDSADLFHHLYQSPSSHCRPNATVPHECGTPFGIT